MLQSNHLIHMGEKVQPGKSIEAISKLEKEDVADPAFEGAMA